MAIRKPLIVLNGQIQEMPVGDSVGTVAAIASYYEPMLTSLGGNLDVCYTNEIMTAIPGMFGTLSEGEIMLDIAGNVITAQAATTNRVPDFLIALNGDIMMGIGA